MPKYTNVVRFRVKSGKQQEFENMFSNAETWGGQLPAPRFSVAKHVLKFLLFTRLDAKSDNVRILRHRLLPSQKTFPLIIAQCLGAIKVGN